jgi:excisionase family DNA binding protein
MPYTLAEAAKATGTNKTTILRAIKSGKISGTKDDHGTWLVEPAELHRVYPPAERSEASNGATQRYAPPAAQAIDVQIAALRDTAELLRAQLDDVRRDRDHWRDQAQAITRQLADARKVQPTEVRPWWRRLAG